MDSFNEFYHQVQCLQLQMEWRLDKLKNVMKCADKIPSRVKTFRERYDIPGLMQANGELHGEAFKHLLDIRNVIQLQMTEYLSNVFPHIRLEKRTPNSRHSKSNNSIIDLKIHASQLQEPRLQLNINPYFAFEWLKTVIGLAMCCFPIVNYNHIAPESVTAPFEQPPEIICVPDTGILSEPTPEFSVNCTSPDDTAENHYCPEPISSSSPSSPGHFHDVFSDSVPIFSQMAECRIKEDSGEQMNEIDECLLPNVVPLESQVTVAVQNMETEEDSFTSPYNSCSSTDTKIICITEPEHLNAQNDSLEQKPLVQTSTEPRQGHDPMCANLKVVEEESLAVESPILTPPRQLRSKFKCKNCSVTFSTSTRLTEHSKSCSSTNNYNENDTDDEDDVDQSISENDDNYDRDSLTSPPSSEEFKQECLSEEDSDLDSSDNEFGDFKPNTQNNVRVTKSRCDTNGWSLKDCLEVYKKTNGKTLLSEKNVSTLKLTATDIQLKGFALLQTCKLSGCESGLFSKDELEYHQSLHGEFKCDLCGFCSNLATKIIAHDFEHCSNLENDLCPRCPKVKVNISDYKKHFVEHHLEKSVNYRCAECPVCSLSFPEFDEVPLVHFVNEHDVGRLNDPEKVFECNEDNCSAYFLTVKQLLRHFKTIHNKTKKMNGGKAVECLIACDSCPLRFISPCYLFLHKKTKHGTSSGSDPGQTVITDNGKTISDILDNQNAKIPCLVKSCKRKYFTEDNRDTHSKHHGTFKCNFCSVKKAFAPDLAVHELEHEDSSVFTQPGFKCKRCAFSTTYKKHYIEHHIQNHLKISPDKITVNCPICQLKLTSTRKTNLKHHMFDHFVTNHDKSEINGSASLLNCAHCPAYFLQQSQLYFHNKRAHCEEMGIKMSLSCDDCHRRFKARRLLLIHRTRIHHKNDESAYQFICVKENCKKRFEYKCDLEYHAKWHSTNSLKNASLSKFVPKPCPDCGKIIYDNQIHFDRHVKSHQEHVCKLCGKTYFTPSVLANHMLTHSRPESWQFTCNVCSKKCPSKRNLAQHMETHPDFPLSESLDNCLKKYKQTDGKMPLSQENIETLKLGGPDVRLKYVESSLQSCNAIGCEPGLYSNADLEYHRHLHGEFQCSFCDFTSNFAISLIEHELEHRSNLENGLCPRCPEVKVDISDYKLHFVENHLETSVQYRCAQCPVCSKSFPNNYQVPLLHFINEHDVSRLNDPEKVFNCNEDNCLAYFLTGKQLIAHSKEAHNITKKSSGRGKVVEQLFACDICPLKFIYLRQLNLHKNKQHRQPSDETRTEESDFIVGYGKFSCLAGSCKNKYFTEEDRNAHFKLHGEFKCEFCAVTKSFAPDLALHEIRLHSKPKRLFVHATFNCSRCEFSSKKREACIRHHIEKHLNLSTEAFTIRCPICKQPFKETLVSRNYSQYSLMNHFRNHHEKTGITDPAELFNCAHCPAYFLAQNQLQLHNQRIHPEQFPSRSRSCDNCNLQFQARYVLLSHRTKVHHNNDESGFEFLCSVENCNKRFEYKCDLEHHIGWHTKYKPKPCPECGKVLMNRHTYESHIKTHQGHVCDQCGKVFKDNFHLVDHLLTHVGSENWKFMCDICSRKCRTKFLLIQHKKSHSKKEKSFICEKCGSTYTQWNNWRLHMTKKHGVSDFPKKHTTPANSTSQKAGQGQQNATSKWKKRA